MINYIEEHLNCGCFTFGKKQSIEIIYIAEETMSHYRCETNCILLLLEGQTKLAINTKEWKIVNQGELFLAPTGILLSYLSLKDCKVLILHTNNLLNICQSFNISTLFKEAKLNKSTLESYKFKTLKMNEHLWDYAKVVDKILTEQLLCINLHRIKIEEFMILLRVYYTKEDLYNFFYFTLNPDTVFFEYVQLNWCKYKTVNEFAASMNFSPQYFTKRFKEIFDQSPGKWIQNKKKKLILSEIQASLKSFQQISDEYGFSSQSHFNRFCKKMFRCSPNVLRGWKRLFQEVPLKNL